MQEERVIVSDRKSEEIDNLLDRIDELKKEADFYKEQFAFMGFHINSFDAQTREVFSGFRKNKKALLVLNGSLDFTEHIIKNVNKAIKKAKKEGIIKKDDTVKPTAYEQTISSIDEILGKIADNLGLNKKDDERDNEDPQEKEE